MVFALEPMVNQGTYKVKILQDGWTAVTRDEKLSAHFEHTIAITSQWPYYFKPPRGAAERGSYGRNIAYGKA